MGGVLRASLQYPWMLLLNYTDMCPASSATLAELRRVPQIGVSLNSLANGWDGMIGTYFIGNVRVNSSTVKAIHSGEQLLGRDVGADIATAITQHSSAPYRNFGVFQCVRYHEVTAMHPFI